MKTILTTLALAGTLVAQYTEQDIVTMTILGEGRGTGHGMYWIASVIQQRSVNRGLTPAQVCLQRAQFSCWRASDPNRAKLPHLLRQDTVETRYARLLARHMGKLDTVGTHHADHYHSGRAPYWARRDKRVAVVGRHTFYRLRNNK